MPNKEDLVRIAYKTKDVKAAIKAHENNEPHTKEKGQYVGDFVYGALDGIVTTFAVVSGVEGAKLAPSVVLILGFANLFADGLSMAVGNYLSTKSELEYFKREREREMWEIETMPQEEKKEIEEIFRKKGFSGSLLRQVVNQITKDKEVWANTMMREELMLNDADKTPVSSAITTLIAFITMGFIPLAAFVAALFIPGLRSISFMVSIILTGLTLFTVGAARTFVTGIHWLRCGLEMLIVGGLAAGVAYYIGYFLSLLGV